MSKHSRSNSIRNDRSHGAADGINEPEAPETADLRKSIPAEPLKPTEQTPPETLPVEQPELKTPEELALAEAKGAGYETVELYLAAKKDADATFTKPTK